MDRQPSSHAEADPFVTSTSTAMTTFASSVEDFARITAEYSSAPPPPPPEPQQQPQPKEVQVTQVQVAQVKGNNDESAGTAPPQYRIWKCDWNKCDAELHNLETFRKHVLRVHVARQGAACGWKGCDANNPLSPGSLRTHVESRHIEAVARVLGDGPSSIGHGRYSSIKKEIESEAYLHDERGRLVTPHADPNYKDPPAIVFPAPPMGIRDFNILYGNSTREQKCMAVLDALRAKKEATGTSLSKEGCTFMNHERLQTVAAFEPLFETVRESPPRQEAST